MSHYQEWPQKQTTDFDHVEQTIDGSNWVARASSHGRDQHQPRDICIRALPLLHIKVCDLNTLCGVRVTVGAYF